MNKSVHRISLDIHDTASQSSINAKKGDTARSIYITLQENSKPYRIAEGCHAVFTGVKPDGNYLFNDCTIKDNVIIYDFTEQTVPVVGQVRCEVALYDANNERITSPRFDIIVNDVVYNGEDIVSSDEANALISATAEAKAITAEVEQKLANGDFVGEKGEKGEQGVKGDKGDKGDKGEPGAAGKDADPQLFANAVKGNVSGSAVRVNDVSPVEHTLSCKVGSKNLLNLTSLLGTTIELNGGALAFGNDGSVTGSGTPTGYVGFTSGKIKLPIDTYVLSLTGSSANIICEFSIRDSNDTILAQLGVYEPQQSVMLELANYPTYDSLLFEIKRRHNSVAMSGTAYFQLEKGITATEYTPYVDPATVTVTRWGADETDNFKTYTPNADGTVEGITSLSPTMTLLTDTDGAVIHCEYNRDTNKALGGASVTKDGTVVSQNADFAEVAEWADGNPDNEDRTGYFVCANVPVDGIVMKKATSIDDVKGVSILAPAFAGNYSKDKLDSNGNLLPKYSYVAIIGFVPVIDNGTCEVGGRCMPDDNGCAVPSSNSMGYQVVNRIDENRVLIIIEPNGDMVQRIKTRVNELQEDIDNLAPDQTYSPTSPNAQSGIAVAEALSRNYELIATIKVTPDENGNLASSIVFSQDNSGKPFELTDFCLSGYFGAVGGQNAKIRVHTNSGVVFGNTGIYSLSETTLRTWWVNYINLPQGALCIAPNTSSGEATHAVWSNGNTSGFIGGIILPTFNRFNSPITTVKFESINSTFIENSEFKLYGVRK